MPSDASSRDQDDLHELKAVYAATAVLLGQPKLSKTRFFAVIKEKVGSFVVFSSNDLSQALKGVWTGPKRRKIMTAIRAYAAAEKLSYSMKPSVESELLSRLNGVWIMVQFRGKRVLPGKVPPLSYRTSLIVYGAEVKGAEKSFKIIGNKTQWSGTAEILHQQVYYWADETTRQNWKEALAMIAVLPPAPTDDHKEHHGINLSVAHDDPGPGNPIYATRVILVRSKILSLKSISLSDNDAIKDLRERYCHYVSDSDLTDKRLNFDKELLGAIEIFKERGKETSNQGDRIFLCI